MLKAVLIAVAVGWGFASYALLRAAGESDDYMRRHSQDLGNIASPDQPNRG